MPPKKPPANRAKTGDGRFKPGVSGNPSGRPKRSTVREFFEAEISDGTTRKDRVLEALYFIATDRKHRDNLKAIELSAAYFAGRPTNFVEVSGDPIAVSGEVDMRSWTTEKTTQHFNDLIARVRARQGRSTKDDDED